MAVRVAWHPIRCKERAAYYDTPRSTIARMWRDCPRLGRKRGQPTARSMSSFFNEHLSGLLIPDIRRSPVCGGRHLCGIKRIDSCIQTTNNIIICKSYRTISLFELIDYLNYQPHKLTRSLFHVSRTNCGIEPYQRAKSRLL